MVYNTISVGWALAIVRLFLGHLSAASRMMLADVKSLGKGRAILLPWMVLNSVSKKRDISACEENYLN